MDSQREGQSTVRPPFLDGSNYHYWKARMRAFLKSIDERVWDSVVDGWRSPTVSETDLTVKAKRDWLPAEIEAAGWNSKALNAIFCSVSQDEFRRISTCEVAKEAWDILLVTYEGTTSVKIAKLQRLTTAFEVIRMAENESFDQFYIKLSDIVNSSANLGETYSQSKICRKILRSLPDRFQPKVTAIEESKDVDQMKAEELVGSLQTYEANMNQNKRHKGIALNSVCEEEDGENDSVKVNADDIAYLVKRFKNFSKKPSPKNSPKFFKGKKKLGEGSKNDRRQEKSGDKQCFECKGYGHYANECANRLKKKNKKVFNASWDNEDDSKSDEDQAEEDSSESGDDSTNVLAFMVKTDECLSKKNSEICNSKKILGESDTSESECEEGTQEKLEVLQEKYDELYQQSLTLAKHKAKVLSKLNNVEIEKETLNNEVENYKTQVCELEKSVDNLKKNEEKLTLLNEALEKEVEDLKKKVAETSTSFKKWNAGTKKLEDILQTQRNSNDKTGLGCEDVFSLSSIQGTGQIKFVSESKAAGGSSNRILGEKPSFQQQMICDASKLKNHTRGNALFNSVSGFRGKHFPKSNLRVSNSVKTEKFVPICHHCGIRGHIRPNCHKLYGLPLDYIKSRVIPVKEPKGRGFLSNRFSGFQVNDSVDTRAPFKPKGNFLNGGMSTSKSKNFTKTVFKGNFLKNNKVRKVWIRCDDLKCFVAHTAFRAQNTNMWYLDSGCSKHMCGVKSMFTSLKDCDEGSVTFGDGNKSKILGIGCIDQPGFPKLKDVLYVDGLKANLISISQICDSNYNVIFAKNECSVLDKDNKVVLKGIRTEDNCYGLSTDKNLVCNVAQDDTTELWHQRLGHVNYRDLAKLSKSEIVKGLPKLVKVKKVVCGPCLKGKQTRAIHKKTNRIATSSILELVHVDLMGPIRTESLGGKKYIFVMVDDFSRFTWVNFLREKSDTFQIFQSLCKRLQNEKGTKIGKIVRLRSDHGKEFENAEFSDFCDECGILHEFSAPKTPQQNGVVERKNRVLQEMTRVMLHAKNLPLRFWAEALNTACYIGNRVFVRRGTKVTPYEIWNGKKPNVKYFHVFGSKCYIYRDREALGKFDARCDEGIFLGYSTNSRAYRVFNLKHSTVMESINIIVDDDCANSSCRTNTTEEEQIFTMLPQKEPVLKEEDKEVDVGDDFNEILARDAEGETMIGEQPSPLNPSSRVKLNHPSTQVIGEVTAPMKTRRQIRNEVTYLCYTSCIEPKNVKEALLDSHWINAMHDELEQFTRNEVWELVPRPSDVNVIGTKWIFKNKTDEFGTIVRNKARLVAQGYTQVEGVDFDETFAPVARLESIRILLAISCYLGFKLFQMDVKSAFLNGFLQEKVFVEQPKGFIDHKYPNHVFRLNKALYGLKQAPRAWYERLTEFLVESNFVRGSVDKTLFIHKDSKQITVAQIYVDDIVFGSTSEKHALKFAELMQSQFEMSMMGELNFFLGLQIKQMNHGIFISQSKYARNLVKKFGLSTTKHARTPMGTSTKLNKDESGKSVDQTLYRSMIGSLLYLTASRPDIAFSVGICARYQSCPKESHVTAVKRIIRYVNGTLDFGIWFSNDSSSEITCYSDADWAGSCDDRKSTSGGCFYIGSNLVAWHSKKQNSISLSTAEAEYIAAGSCCTQALWMKQMLLDYGINQGTMSLFCDNLSAINISKNPVQHSRTKHIDIRHHFIRDLVERQVLSLKHIPTAHQLADLFTKPLDASRFEHLRSSLGIILLE